MGESRAVSTMPSGEAFSPACRLLTQRHVDPWINALTCAGIETSTCTLNDVRVGELVKVLVMQDEPKFEARVGYRQSDLIRTGQIDGFFQIGVVLRPFHIKKTSAFVDFRVLLLLDC